MSERMYVAYDPETKKYLHRKGSWRPYPFLWRLRCAAQSSLGWAQGKYRYWSKAEPRYQKAEVIEVVVTVKRVVRTELVEYQEIA